MVKARCQSRSTIRRLARPRLNVSLGNATDVTDLIGSSGLLCFKPVVHGGRKAWPGWRSRGFSGGQGAG